MNWYFIYVGQTQTAQVELWTWVFTQNPKHWVGIFVPKESIFFIVCHLWADRVHRRIDATKLEHFRP